MLGAAAVQGCERSAENLSVQSLYSILQETRSIHPRYPLKRPDLFLTTSTIYMYPMSLLHDKHRNGTAVKAKLSQQEKEHIWQLMCEKMAGIISPKDLRYLEAQLPKDEYMREALQTLAFALGEEEYLDLDSLQHDDEWKDIFQEINPHPQEHTGSMTHFRPGKLMAAAAIAGLILSGAGYYYFSKEEIPQTTKTAAPANKEVRLKLADQRTITLPGQPSLISLGDVQLHNDQQSLSFDAKDEFNVRGQHTLIVPAAKDYKVVLADGTEIWLNADSRLQFPFSFNGNSREITLLSGEAYVKAAPDPFRPLIIHTPQSTIRVLGTEFNINAYDRNLVRVSLVSGAVKMSAGHDATVIKPGMEAVYTGKQGLITRPFDPGKVLSWRDGKHFFVQAPITEICTILGRYLGITAVIDSGSRAQTKRFSGMVDKHEPIEEFMQDVKSTVDVDHYFDKNGVLHFR
jgi:transmembrane sensor